MVDRMVPAIFNQHLKRIWCKIILCLAITWQGSAGSAVIESASDAPITASRFEKNLDLVSAGDSQLPSLGDAGEDALTLGQERRLGEAVMRQYQAAGMIYEDDEAQAYIQALGQRILQAELSDVHGGGFKPRSVSEPYVFFLVKDKSLNAFALPGGFIGIHTGLIAAAQTESELASVLAHEIGHVQQRHIARMFSQQKNQSALSIAAMALAILAARSNPDAGMGIMAAGTGLSIAQQLGFSREAEREADRLGFQMLVRAGFEPADMVRFFQRLQQSTRLYENNAPVYLRTHPLTVERIADVQARVSQLAEQSSRQRQAASNEEYPWVRVKMMILGDTSVEGLRTTLTRLEASGQSAMASGSSVNALPDEVKQYGKSLIAFYLRDYAKSRKLLATIPRSRRSAPWVDRLQIRISVAMSSLGQRVAQEGQTTVLIDKLFAITLQTPVSTSGLSVSQQDADLTHAQSLATQRLLIEWLQQQNRHAEAEQRLRAVMEAYGGQASVYEMRARSLQVLGRLAEQHLMLAMALRERGGYAAAIEQLQLGKKHQTQDFYIQSEIDSVLRETKAKLQEALKERQ